MLLHRPDCAPAFALLGAVAVLASSERSPVFAGLMGVELTHPPLPYVGAVAVVAAGMVVVFRVLPRLSASRPEGA